MTRLGQNPPTPIMRGQSFDGVRVGSVCSGISTRRGLTVAVDDSSSTCTDEAGVDPPTGEANIAQMLCHATWQRYRNHSMANLALACSTFEQPDRATT
jgi:hypothetical protein